MLESAYVLPVGKDYFTAVEILEIENYTGELPKTFWSFVANVGKAQGTSIEFLTEGVYGRQFADVIIRVSGETSEYVATEVCRLSEVFQEYLKKSGCKFERKGASELSKYDGRMLYRENLHICIPGEHLRGIKQCYAPGGYDLIAPLNMKDLWMVITRHTGIGMSIQCRATEFYSDERKLIRHCVNKYSEYKNNLQIGKAKSTYQKFEAMSLDDVFFVTITVWGNEETIKYLLAVLRENQFNYVEIPKKVSRESDYFAEGHIYVPFYAAKLGHSIPKGVKLEQTFNRLNYITNEDTLVRITNGQKINGSAFAPKTGTSSSPDVTYEPLGIQSSGGMDIGVTDGEDQRAIIPWNALTKHMVIAGMPGCGKTTMVFQMLHQAYKSGLPFIVIEPTKTEYRELINSIPDLKVYTPGRTDVNPIMFNPFLPPKGVTLEQFLPSLVSAFQLAFILTTPLDVIFLEVVRNCYVKYGWRNDSTSDSPEVTVFGIHEFICAFKDEVNRSSYDSESKQNLLSGGVYRFQALINNNPYLFDTDKSLDIEEMMKGHTIIELDAIDNNDQRALILNLLLLQIKLVIRKNQTKDSRLKNLILMDEAHVLLSHGSGSYDSKGPDVSGKLIEYILDMVKVNRAYGTGMIFADQSLSIMKPFFDYSNVKVVMRLEAASERKILADSLSNGEEVYENIASLTKGEFFMMSEETGRPIRGKAYDTRKQLSIPDDMDDDDVKAKMKASYERPFTACTCKRSCDLQTRTEAEYIARQICMKKASSFANEMELEKYLNKKLEEDLIKLTENDDNEKRLLRCAKIMTERMLRQKASFEMDEE